jgi:hypothetical protein
MNATPRPRVRSCLPVLLLATLAPGAHADSRLDYAVEGTCPVVFQAIEAAGPRLRFETQPAGGEPYVSIFDGDEDLVTGLMPAQRKFMQIEVDADSADYSGDVASSMVKYMERQMAQAKAQMAEHKKQCGRQCAQMPDFDLDAMMNAARAASPPIEARDTGEAGDVAGVACQWREWVQAGQVVRRECLAKFADMPLPERDRAGLQRGMRVMVQFSAAYAPMTQRFGLAPEPQAPVGQVPAAQVCFAGGSEAGRATLSMREAPVDPARFAIPPGYTPVMGPGSESAQP